MFPPASLSARVRHSAWRRCGQGPMRKPVPSPGRLHSLLKTGRVHLRQLFQLARALTPAHQGGELFHVLKRFANCGEAPAKVGSLDLELGYWNPPLSLLCLNLNCWLVRGICG